MRGLLALLIAVALQANPVHAGGGETVVILLRHAEKAAEPARDPGLSGAGRRRAEALSRRFSEPPLAAVYATPYRRTQLTAAPIAAAHGLPITVRPAGEAPKALAQTLRQRHAGQRVLLVGHSNTVPAIAAALSGAAVEPMPDSEYDRYFVVLLPEQGAPSLQTHRLAPQTVAK
jgi:broad specificity phosphatase PhoE